MGRLWVCHPMGVHAGQGEVMHRKYIEIKDAAMDTQTARELSYQGWTIDNIRSAVCAECGEIDQSHFSFGSEPNQSGVKVDYLPNGNAYHAGHICACCMCKQKGANHGL